MIDKELQQFYNIAKEKAEYWLSLLFESCGSPIEKKFIGHFYSFFLKEGHPIQHNLLYPKGMWTINDKTGKSINVAYYSIENEHGFALEFDGHDLKNAQIFDEYIREELMYWGFTMHSSGIKYHIIPQYPVFDNSIIKFLDFGVFAYDLKNNEIGRFDIECDGHEWHSTKEQLKADNIRSRFLSKNSFHPIRYSGSEIYAMNDETVLELENMMYKYIFKKESDLYQLRKY
ncbi:hypothetical protein [Ferruginibacter sp.]|nr:hypothetical protein [Ferruginibacter sp.]